MDRVYRSQDHNWLSVHGRCNHSRVREVVMIARREKERGGQVLTNYATWRRSFGDGHMMVLNRGGQWCSNANMVPGVTA
jgi:hypothetical protein